MRSTQREPAHSQQSPTRRLRIDTETVHCVLRSLLLAEEQSAGTAGVLPVLPVGPAEAAGQPGMILAERGRICWVSDLRCSSRLSDLLLAASGITRRHLEKVFRFCRRTGRPVGEHLIALGIVTEEQLREALLAHNCAALLALGSQMRAGRAAATAFQECPRHSYDSTMAFSALELVMEMVRKEPELGVAVGPAPQTFERWAPQVHEAICFRETSWQDFPGMPVSCSGEVRPMNLGDTCQLFRRCRSLAEPPTLAAAEIHPFTTVVRNGDHGWLTSHIAPHFCLYRIDCLSELGSILTGIMKESQEAEGLVG